MVGGGREKVANKLPLWRGSVMSLKQTTDSIFTLLWFWPNEAAPMMMMGMSSRYRQVTAPLSVFVVKTRGAD